GSRRNDSLKGSKSSMGHSGSLLSTSRPAGSADSRPLRAERAVAIGKGSEQEIESNFKVSLGIERRSVGKRGVKQREIGKSGEGGWSRHFMRGRARSQHQRSSQNEGLKDSKGTVGFHRIEAGPREKAQRRFGGLVGALGRHRRSQQERDHVRMGQQRSPER